MSTPQEKYQQEMKEKDEQLKNMALFKIYIKRHIIDTHDPSGPSDFELAMIYLEKSTIVSIDFLEEVERQLTEQEANNAV